MRFLIYTTADGHEALEHGGGTGGSKSSFHCFPALNSGFVILTNSLANRRELEKELALIVTRQDR
jgi:D-alanyl-D-alanine-carboxypeptidase/D-alanyl-D-alanine-endopeptidase